MKILKSRNLIALASITCFLWMSHPIQADFKTGAIGPHGLSTRAHAKSVQPARLEILYKDRANNTIARPHEVLGTIGDPYHAVAPSLSGFVLDSIKGQESGTFQAPKEVLTYVYRRSHVAAGAIDVYYLDREGNALSNKESISGLVGQTYEVAMKPLEGYVFLGMIGKKSGVMDLNGKDVALIYEKKDAKEHKEALPIAKPALRDETSSTNQQQTLHGEMDQRNPEVQVKVEHLLIGSGSPELFGDPTLLEGNVGDAFAIGRVRFPGLKLVDIYGPETGTMQEDVTNVVYVYNRVNPSKVVARYTLLDGTQLSNPESYSDYVGEGYLTQKKEIAGYSLIAVEGEEYGVFTEAHKEVTYFYVAKEPATPGVPEEGGSNPSHDEKPPTNDNTGSDSVPAKPTPPTKPESEHVVSTKPQEILGHDHSHGDHHDHEHEHPEFDHDHHHHGHGMLPATGISESGVTVARFLALIMLGSGIGLIMYRNKQHKS